MRLHERIFPECHTHTQATGRFSIVRPPLSQLPSDIRDIICPDPGMVCIGHDWDGIELRIQAALAGDQPLLEAFAKLWDVHTYNACDIFRWAYPPNLVNPHEDAVNEPWRVEHVWQGKGAVRRVFAKRFVYRLIYRGNPKHAGDIPGARVLGLDAKRLVEASENWLAAHPAIRTYWARIDREAKERGYTETWAGRKRRALSVSPNGLILSSTLRELSNQPMQGGVSCILNHTIIALVERCPWLTYFTSAFDSLWMECPEEREAETWPVYQQVVQQTRSINGIQVEFPAEFKVMREDGKAVKVTC